MSPNLSVPSGPEEVWLKPSGHRGFSRQPIQVATQRAARLWEPRLQAK